MEKEKKSDTCSLFPSAAEGREKKCLAESEELKSLLMKVKEESERDGLKHSEN